MMSQYLKAFPLLFIVMTINIMLVFIARYLFMYKNTSRDYKIYNFTINTIILAAYFSIFVGLMLYLRYLRWGFSADLKLIWANFIAFFSSIPPYFSLTILLLALIGYLLLIHAKNYMIKCLFKRHLYHYYKLSYNTLLATHKNNPDTCLAAIYIKYPLYVRIIKDLTSYWSFEMVMFRYLYNNIGLPYSILSGNHGRYPLWLQKLEKGVGLFLRYLPILVLLLTSTYEFLFNNYVFHYVFYYLPGFVIIQTYIKLTDFLYKTSGPLNRIIYERYYEEDNVLYVNTTDEEDKFILDYISGGFICYSRKVTGEGYDERWQKVEAILNWAPNFMHIRRFTRITGDKPIFENSIGEQITSEGMIIYEVYK